ncbi:MAG: hypothetical protein QME47_08230, partial [Candidatus Thermoplasmatota archaeon]|nr:hypothetical protein [Candidatus Thermoplasmatota archaeon]
KTKQLVAYWTEDAGEFIIKPAVTSRGIDSAIVTKCSKQEIFEFCTKVGLRIISVKRFWWSDEIKEKSDTAQ